MTWSSIASGVARGLGRCAVASILALPVLVPAGPSASNESIRAALPPRPPRFVAPASRVLFADDFSADTLAGWAADRDGVWSIRRGMLRGDLPDRKQERSLIRAGALDWDDYAVDLDVCLMRGVDKGVVVRLNGTEGIGVDMRGPGYHDVLLQQGFRTLGRANVVNGNAIWHHLRVEARGHAYRVFVNGGKVIETRDRSRTSLAGGIALPAYTGGVGECTVYYDNVIVTDLTPQTGDEKENP